MKKMNRAALAASLAAAAAFLLVACDEKKDAPAERYSLDAVTGPSPFHGIHGITVEQDGTMLAGSVIGRTIYKVDPASGETSVYEGPPLGMADDLEQGPDGTLAWTAFLDGKVYARKPDGTLLTLAKGLPGMNSIAWTDDGRLFATQVFLGDALYELDPEGKKQPRKIMEGMGGLNGFDFGPDGKLYGPLWNKGEIARVDVDKATLEVVATGFGIPAAANFSPDGKLYAVDTQRGEVVRVDPANGEKEVVAKVKPAIDNLAFDNDGNLFITNMADNAVIAVDTKTGKSRTIVSGPLAVAGGIARANEDGEDVLYIADAFSFRKLHLASGKIDEIGRMWSDKIDYPLNVSVANGRVTVAGITSGAVQVFDQESGKSLALMHGFVTPSAAIAMTDGRIVIAEYAKGSLVMVDPEHPDERKEIVTGLEGPESMMATGDGAIYVSETEGGVISRIAPDTGERTVLVADLEAPEGFDIAPDGKLIVAEVGAKRITAIDPESGKKEVLRNELPIGLEGPGELPSSYIPTGVSVGPKGDIYFSSDIDARIYRLKEAGAN